ncbi:MAG: hypothetical protein VR68_01035 [Peptococcaceae bacterium BRH_c4a]|nr:MAG: hypothetical protein VR68_01035 [Peptococcaceae bacterium BRH_c4a]
MSKSQQIRKLVESRVSNHVTAIYSRKVANQIQCSIEEVEDVLNEMVEEQILRHVYELHCCQCGHVMDVSEIPQFFTGTAECLGCWTQTESITMNDIMGTYYPLLFNWD